MLAALAILTAAIVYKVSEEGKSSENAPSDDPLAKRVQGTVRGHHRRG